jgi:hypothetical protein
MGDNQDLLNLNGRIHQLVEYGIFTVDELNHIQSFCRDEISRLNSSGFIEREKINWNEYEIREQTSGDEIDAVTARNMTDSFSIIAKEYKEPLDISYEVITDLFQAYRKMEIFLGASKSRLFFLFEDEKEKKYYTLDNNLRKEEVTWGEFDSYKSTYNEGLKTILDKHIHEYDATTSNTERFTLRDTFYDILKKLRPTYPNLVISFNPAIHTSDEVFEVITYAGRHFKASYKCRLTFIMILGYYEGNKFIPIPGKGFYDRNGLCPPGC